MTVHPSLNNHNKTVVTSRWFIVIHHHRVKALSKCLYTETNGRKKCFVTQIGFGMVAPAADDETTRAEQDCEKTLDKRNNLSLSQLSNSMFQFEHSFSVHGNKMKKKT